MTVQIKVYSRDVVVSTVQTTVLFIQPIEMHERHEKIIQLTKCSPPNEFDPASFLMIVLFCPVVLHIDGIDDTVHVQ